MECDPDACKGCRNVVTGEEAPPNKERCQNMRLRLRQHKRIAVGLSSVAGWGAFLLVMTFQTPKYFSFCHHSPAQSQEGWPSCTTEDLVFLHYEAQKISVPRDECRYTVVDED